ncbi:MAG TPA: hypothetical protein VHO02_04630 [Fibrobacteria bacterium]|nr:hypothetical protein [Fibrobacteria bacterium]
MKKSKPAKKPAKAKPAPKKAAAKKPAPAKKAAPKKVAPAKKAAAKPAPKAKAPVKAAPKAKAQPEKKIVAAKAVPAKAAAAALAKPAKEVPAAKAPKAAKEPKPAPVVEVIPALADVKRPAKPFFMEVKPGVERVIKRGDKTAASQAIDLQARRKGPTAEETPEELAERIERELQSQSFLRRTPMRRQMCTKCGINAVAPRFTIDRELGYCDSCAEILRLGETKEAKRMEFSLAVKKDEGEAAESEDAAPEEGEEEPVPEDLDD